jgi:hypothetical protein
MNRLDIIQKTINKKKARHYLEIGVEKGKVFLNVTAWKKIAVDPNLKIKPKKKIRACFYITTIFFNNYYEMTSDDFFASQRQYLTRLKGIDVAFIDGLHTHEQTLKDIENCLKYLREDGVIIMHDCNPTSEIQASPAASRDQAADYKLHGNRQAWSGDVWKTIVHLRSVRNDLNVFVLDCDHGVGIVTHGRPENVLAFSAQKIKDLCYDDLVKDREHILNLKPPDYLQKFLDSCN